MDCDQSDAPTEQPKRLRHHTRAPVGSLSRRRFIKTAAGVAGAALSADLWMPALAHADSAGGVPVPIPHGGLGLPIDFRVFPFGPEGKEPITITDFNGLFGVTDVQGMATDTSTGERLLFDTDLRFMDGVFIGTDGRTHQGTFGLI
jgi:hypothetical protein